MHKIPDNKLKFLKEKAKEIDKNKLVLIKQLKEIMKNESEIDDKDCVLHFNRELIEKSEQSIKVYTLIYRWKHY